MNQQRVNHCVSPELMAAFYHIVGVYRYRNCLTSSYSYWHTHPKQCVLVGSTSNTDGAKFLLCMMTFILIFLSADQNTIIVALKLQSNCYRYLKLWSLSTYVLSYYLSYNYEYAVRLRQEGRHQLMCISPQPQKSHQSTRRAGKC